MTGRHSVIDRPESVNRVSPPTNTIAVTIMNMTINQTRIAARDPRPAPSIMPPDVGTGPAVPTSSKMLRLPAICRPCHRLPEP